MKGTNTSVGEIILICNKRTDKGGEKNKNFEAKTQMLKVTQLKTELK